MGTHSTERSYYISKQPTITWQTWNGVCPSTSAKSWWERIRLETSPPLPTPKLPYLTNSKFFDASRIWVKAVLVWPFFLSASYYQNWRKITKKNYKMTKNLWRRKCVRRAIFRTVEVKVEGRFVPFNPYFVCNTTIGSLCDLYGVLLPKKLTWKKKH